jgi:hypothetical protein
MKQEYPFRDVQRKPVKVVDPFATEKRAVRKSIAGLNDFDAMIEIVLSYAAERKRMSDIGALNSGEAAADIARAGKLLDKMISSVTPAKSNIF